MYVVPIFCFFSQRRHDPRVQDGISERPDAADVRERGRDTVRGTEVSAAAALVRADGLFFFLPFCFWCVWFVGGAFSTVGFCCVSGGVT